MVRVNEVDDLEGVELFKPPMACADDRGEMWAYFDAEEVSKRGGTWEMHEATVAVSYPGVVRGLHYARRRAKYVTCLVGKIYDVAIDLRQGSPTFGKWKSHELSDENRHAVYIEQGFGHGYQSLEPSVVAYLYTTPYVHEDYAAINPLDPAIGIIWPADPRTISRKDSLAPILSDAEWLPKYQEHT
jgi:dTDP-4-dehydrorhamnose 3,5-epimerase